MKSITSSYKSTTSLSLKSVKIADKGENKAIEFDKCVEIAWKKFNIPCQVVVTKEIQDDSLLKSLKQELKTSRKTLKRVLSKRESLTLLADKNEDEIVNTPVDKETKENVLTISSVYDSQNKLVEILINGAKRVPREVIKILSFILPQFPFLIRIGIKKCKIDKYTIFEISQFLDVTSVTDICLDGSTCREANFALLLQNSRISSLSLCRCGINDAVCETIASQLHYTRPVQCCLATLNLSSNRITDVGAKCLSLTLRSNRYLRYLNLADNSISDEGASYILKPLMYFPLTFEEFNAERALYAKYLKDKCAWLRSLAKTFKSKEADSKLKKKKVDKPSSGITKDKKRIPNLKEKLSSNITVTTVSSWEPLCFNEIDSFQHPFSNDNVKRVDGVRCCTGNMVLCYLNLAYNNISTVSVKKLNEVLKYQSETKKSYNYGLIKVVIEGNNLASAVDCNELKILSDHLNSALIHAGKIKK